MRCAILLSVILFGALTPTYSQTHSAALCDWQSKTPPEPLTGNLLVVVDVFPMRKTPIFLRVGSELAPYQNNRPGDLTARGGPGWLVVEYEISLTENLGLAPIVDYATGSSAMLIRG
jgi:hypothetical protein